MPTTQPPPARDADRRVAARRQPTMGAICRFDAGPDGKPAIGLLWNLSLTGVSMLLHDPWGDGAAVAGVLETLDGAHALPVTARVVHMKRLETGDYFMGAHFDRPLTEDEVRPFVS